MFSGSLDDARGIFTYVYTACYYLFMAVPSMTLPFDYPTNRNVCQFTPRPISEDCRYHVCRMIVSVRVPIIY